MTRTYPLSAIKALLLIKLLTVVTLSTSFSVARALIVGKEAEFIDPAEPFKPGKGLKGHEREMAVRMVKSVRQLCPECHETTVVGKWGREHRFMLPNGYWIQISWDPNVVEVLSKPTTLEKVRETAPQIQKLIWESAAAAGLSPDPARRAGHFNFAAKEAFNNNTAEFVKFIVDFSNRPELALGIFRASNPLNAPHLAQLAPEQRAALAEIALRIQNKKDPLSKMTLQQMAQHLVKTVFYKSATPGQWGSSAWYYQALGLKNLLDVKDGADAPLEIRAMRSQRDVYDFILIGEIIEARIAYLKSLPVEVSLLVSQTARTDFTDKALATRFFIYLKEAGLAYEKYQRLLPEKFAMVQPHEALIIPKITAASFQDMKEFLSILDLAPTSPWLQARLREIFASSEVPAESRALILAELRNLTQKGEYSEAMKKELQKLHFNLEFAPAPSCQAVFL